MKNTETTKQERGHENEPHRIAVETGLKKVFGLLKANYSPAVAFIIGASGCAPALLSSPTVTPEKKEYVMGIENFQGDPGSGLETWKFSEVMDTPWGRLVVRGYINPFAKDSLQDKTACSLMLFPIKSEELVDRMIFLAGSTTRDPNENPEHKKISVLQAFLKKEGENYLVRRSFSDGGYENAPISMVWGAQPGYDPVFVVSPNKEAVFSVINGDAEIIKGGNLFPYTIPGNDTSTDIAKKLKALGATAFRVSFEKNGIEKIE